MGNKTNKWGKLVALTLLPIGAAALVGTGVADAWDDAKREAVSEQVSENLLRADYLNFQTRQAVQVLDDGRKAHFSRPFATERKMEVEGDFSHYKIHLQRLFEWVIDENPTYERIEDLKTIKEAVLKMDFDRFGIVRDSYSPYFPNEDFTLGNGSVELSYGPDCELMWLFVDGGHGKNLTRFGTLQFSSLGEVKHVRYERNVSLDGLEVRASAKSAEELEQDLIGNLIQALDKVITNSSDAYALFSPHDVSGSLRDLSAMANSDFATIQEASGGSGYGGIIGCEDFRKRW